MEEGLNRRCRELLWAIERDVKLWVEEHGVTSVVQLGDFFDGPRPSGAVLDASIRMIQNTGVPWHILRGNHDIASYEAPSAIAPLGHVPGVTIYERPTLANIDGFLVGMVPYMGPDAAAEIDKACQELFSRHHPYWSSTQMAREIAQHWAHDEDLSHQIDFMAVHYGFVRNPSRSDHAPVLSIFWQYPRDIQWFYGHEHTSSHVDHRQVSIGSYGNVTFGDCMEGNLPTVHESAIYCSPSKILRVGNGGPALIDFAQWDLVYPWADMVRWLLERLRGAPEPPSIYVRVQKQHVGLAEMLVACKLVTGYLIAPAVPREETVDMSNPPPPADTYMDCVDAELGEDGKSPEAINWPGDLLPGVRQLCMKARQP